MAFTYLKGYEKKKKRKEQYAIETIYDPQNLKYLPLGPLPKTFASLNINNKNNVVWNLKHM